MKRYTKKKPLWLCILGTDKRCATMLGVEHYLLDNQLDECTIITKQDGEEVNHPTNRMVVRVNHAVSIV